MKYPLIEITLLTSFLGIILFALFSLRKNRIINLMYASLTVEELELHAKRTALTHTVIFKRNIMNWPLNRINENYGFIKSVYNDLNEDIKQKKAVPSAAEWILDNYYIIEEQTKGIRRDLTKKEYYKLPILSKGIFKGYTRVLAIAMEFVAIVDGQIDEVTLLKYLDAYQTHNILFDREIRMIPMMIQIALLERSRSTCESIRETRRQWALADTIIEKWWSDDVMDGEKILNAFKNTLENKVETNESFIEHLFYRFRRSGRSYINVLKAINEYLEQFGTSVEIVAQKEHNAQAVHSVSMGNDILSFKYLTSLNWTDIFEALSYVEKILRQDPYEMYCKMNSSSKGYYLMWIEKLAKKHEVSERHIAQIAINLASAAADQTEELQPLDNKKSRRSHVGYYLVGEGVEVLEKALNTKEKLTWKITGRAKKYQGKLYMSMIIFLLSLLIAVAVNYTISQINVNKWLFGLIVILVIFIPASEISIAITNWLVGKIKKPSFFPALELKEGIPDALSSMVVIPTLLNDENRVDEMLRNLEYHYLANKEKNLYFSLIGGFKDSACASSLTENPILMKAQKGISKLNSIYSKDGTEIFYFFHRKNMFNESEQNWTGWERKRGALMEFNELLLGAQNTSFVCGEKYNFNKIKIKYIITLDSDTQLPLGMAKKMIGTMAHPNNLPVIDPVRNIVVEGHGLIQPRILFDMESSGTSVFSRIFTGQVGIDPYANAVSDVYQDLFDEGIFTGKGIYDLRVFREILKEVVPENAVLSHDLLEGSYVRAALVSDLELVDSYPTKYNAYMARLYRWIRGDWQLIPWLRKVIYNKNNKVIVNPLSRLSIWKITDNLRRSLLSPSLILLIIMAIGFLPGKALFWLTYVFLVLLLPVLMNMMEYIIRKRFNLRVSKSHILGAFGLKSSLMQQLLSVVFLSYQAAMVMHAIMVTLVRVLITKKKMLEWITSDDVEKLQSSSIKSYVKSMGFSSLLGVLLISIAIVFKPENLMISLILGIIWASAPFLACFISKGKKESTEVLMDEEVRYLRKTARKTWRYFEEFANKKNNYLAPDNYQEEPYKGIAYRTSPTNIGLGLLATLTARDLGYIGIEETFKQIERTMGTLTKLEKWHGHLYNWYDTKTLEPLKPNYISTVDSGNLVCYLITLRQGLIGYYKRPIIDRSLINGIEDTFANGVEKSISFFEKADIQDTFCAENEISLLGWKRLLESAIINPKTKEIKKDAWHYKLEHMIREYLKELENFTPWVNLLECVPASLYQEGIKDVTVSLVTLLDIPPSMQNYESHCSDICKKSEILIAYCQNNQKESELGELDWLKGILSHVEKGLENIRTFISHYEYLIEEIYQITEATHFEYLYENKRQLFSIGFNLETNRLSNSYYDLLASEARQTSFIAIARGEIEPKHWIKLGRSLTVVDRYKGLVSWSGTMFEYLMPLILMKNYRNTLLDETYSFVLISQKKYGKERHVPWGASESGFGLLDLHLDYQYKAIGVPWIGLKRGLIEDVVTAPYATFLALQVNPKDSYKNLEYLKREGLEGDYGFYEAVDYTPERLNPGQHKIIVKSFMAHHQGMSFLALNNYLNKSILQERFFSDPYVNASKLLLQEKVPANILYTKENKEKIIPFKGSIYHDKGSYRHLFEPNEYLPKVHILSNGYYSVLITDKGTGCSRTKDYSVTRWREDSIADRFGIFFYIKNSNSGKKWSATYAPLNILPNGYEVVFTADKTMIKRTDESIETRTEIIVASGENAEIRRIELKNNSEEPCNLELTSYMEVVLTGQKNDEAHPTFSNLFVETEFWEKGNALIAHRRSRVDKNDDLWIAQMAVIDGEQIGEIQYETDRMQFIGRGREVSNPIVLECDGPLSNSIGNVLDPILSLRARVKVFPDSYARISFVTITGNSKEQILELLVKYSSIENCDAAFWLAVVRSQIETKYLNMKAHEIELYQDMISHIIYLSPLRREQAHLIEKNNKGQKALWNYGISGDRPIVLVKIRNVNEVEILYELLKAHEYWRLKDLHVDLIILVMEVYSYINPVFALVSDIVESSQEMNANYKKGDIFILNFSMIAVEDMYLLTALARLCFYGDRGTISDQLQNLPEEKLEPFIIPETNQTKINYTYGSEKIQIDKTYYEDPESLEFYNGIGGFSKDNQCYTIFLENNQNTPVPWTNIIANETFGFLTTESGGGYTWCNNSQENKLTPWTNDPVCDSPGEIFYLRDEEANIWSFSALPIRENNLYIIEHGYGYTTYKHRSHGIFQELTQFVPLKGNVKISIISLTNDEDEERHISLTYYIEPVLGGNRSETAMHLVTDITEEGILTVKNNYNQIFIDQVLYMDTSIKQRSYSGNRKKFFGKGNRKSPEELKRIKLSNCVGAGFDTCVAMQVEVRIPPNEKIQVIFTMGLADNKKDVLENANLYNQLDKAKEALEAVRIFWAEKLGIIKVNTPDMAMNQMMNGHLLYQVIVCRIWARTAFYQAGGAYGFRDQLQDTLSILPVWPEMTRAQIVKHAGHQFIEGDVLHWWHEPELKGTRTRISDDFLWLPYVVAQYLTVTADREILEEVISYLKSDLLKEFEEEHYVTPSETNEKGSLYEHCIRSIDHGLNFGEHGLPLIGTGDWNDGMNKVGNEGKGESIWLAWFLSDILKKWVPICEMHHDIGRSQKYSKINKKLVEAVEKYGWDGNWYRRAYFDNGSLLGSVNNIECKIDSIAQSWAVLSESGNTERAIKAMASLEDYLVNHNDGIIRLLTPPFYNGNLEPGYIKGYLPGVRENGGQYSHAAAWVVIAFAKLGDGDKAFNLFEMINPINHARTNTELGIYKTEPYAMAADVYGCRPHIGRGGWSWYTGAAGWMYQAGLNSILGFHKVGSDLIMEPCIPKRWQDFSLQYTHKGTVYNIRVSNPEGISSGVTHVKVNGLDLFESRIPLVEDQGIQNVEVVLSRT